MFENEPLTPDGSPLSDWDSYEFTPREDITAHELALILQAWGKSNKKAGRVNGFGGPFYVRRVDNKWANFDQVHRHFTKQT